MPSHRPRALAVTTALLAAVTGPLRAQQTPTGVVVKSGAAEISINGRVQTQFNTTSVDDEPATLFELRRLRLEATLKINDVVSGKIQPDFAPGNRVVMKDAYMDITLDPAFRIRAGQAHRPFSPITITSSTRILPIERGVRIRGVDNDWDEFNLVADLGYADRDVGLQVMGAPSGAPLGFSYAAGWFNGPARSAAPDQNTYQLAARVAVEPVRHLKIGAGWSSRDFVEDVEEPIPGETLDTERGNAWEADLEYGSYSAPGLHFVSEVAYGDFNSLEDTKFFGAQGWLAFRTDTVSSKIVAIEPVVRVSYGDTNFDDNDELDSGGGTLITPGVNLYLGGLNRVMFNWDFWNPLSGESANSFKAQFQLAW